MPNQSITATNNEPSLDQYFYYGLDARGLVLGWPNGSGGSLQSCSIWVQFPSPALSPEQIDFVKYLRQNLREVVCRTEIKTNEESHS